MKKQFILYLDELEKKKIKKRAEREGRSINSYIKHQLKQAESEPNISTGNWWDDPTEIKQMLEELRKKIK